MPTRGGLFAAGPDQIRVLREFGADLNSNVEDESPLLHAVKSRRFDTARALLEAGADPNRADSKGATPLHYAVRQYHEVGVVELLLGHGASPDARSSSGVTPLSLATRMGRHDVVAALSRHSNDAAVSAFDRGIEPPSGEVRLQPFLAVEGDRIEDIVRWYERLGFVCDGFSADGPWAKLSLDGASFMLNPGGARGRSRGESLLYRCPPDAYARVERALEEHGIARRGEEGLGLSGGLTLQLDDTRIHLLAGKRAETAIHLWLDCAGFDALYHRARTHFDVAPPDVAFHGIFFSLEDPDAHRLTFNGPATDL